MHKRGQRKTTLDNKDIDINSIICSNKMQFFNHFKKKYMYMHNQNIVVFSVKAKEKVKGKTYVD